MKRPNVTLLQDAVTYSHGGDEQAELDLAVAWRRQHAQCVWQAIQFTALLALHYDRCPVDFQMLIEMPA